MQDRALLDTARHIREFDRSVQDALYKLAHDLLRLNSIPEAPIEAGQFVLPARVAGQTASFIFVNPQQQGQSVTIVPRSQQRASQPSY